MTAQQVKSSGAIDNTPETVLGYIADVRNRTFYLPSLKAITDVQGEPTSASTTWKWTWVLIGMEFTGTGKSVAYEPGKRYAFKTDGGIDSTWTYTVAPEGKGTRLTLIHSGWDALPPGEQGVADLFDGGWGKSLEKLVKQVP